MPLASFYLPVQILADHAAKHASTPAGSSFWTMDVPGWITATCTGILALFAIVAAYYARKAFFKQSQEVRAIEQQVKDQAELLELQRKVFEEQHKVNAKQLNVLGLQADQLRLASAKRDRAAERVSRKLDRYHLPYSSSRGRTRKDMFEDMVDDEVERRHR